MSKKEDFYLKLKDSLEATTKFPSEYLYKFIVPAKGNQVIEIEELFKDTLAKISFKESKTGKYVSVSIKVTLSSSLEVISNYRKAEKIEGIISL
jgi:putative lipoic acid-binding regulatory protein